MALQQKIYLRARNDQEEAIASGILSPGNLLQMDSADKVLKHAVEGGDGMVRVALEDGPYQGYRNGTGRDKNSAYAVGDTVFFRECLPGDVVLVLLRPGTNYNTLNAQLIHDGSGQLKLASAMTGGLTAVRRIVAEVQELINLSATAAVATLAKVRIVG